MRLALRWFLSKSSSTTTTTKTTTTHCYHRYYHCRFFLFQLILIVATTGIATISLVTVTADDASTITFPTTNDITRHYQQYRQRQRHEQTRTTVPSVTAFNFQPNCTATKNKERKGRWYSGRNKSSSCYWKEIVDDKTNTYTNLNYKDNNYITNENGKNKIKIQRLKQRRRKRFVQLYFGKIKLSSMYDVNYNDDDDDDDRRQDEDGRKEIEEHPLRSELWEMDVTWSFLFSKSNKLMMAQCGNNDDCISTRQRKRTQKRKKLELELHPEGYCRIIEVKKFPWKKKRKQQQGQRIFKNENETEHTSNKRKDDINKISSVVGIGRWNKRPWGVTIVVRPLLLSPSPPPPLPPFAAAAVSLDNNKVAKPKQKPKKSSTKIDENTEYIFHARDFHWNGFGSNPKLTRGTILLETQKNSNEVCWWKSSTSSYSSILPVWPEELQRGDMDEVTNPGNGEGEGSSPDGFLRPMNIVKRLLSSMDSSSSSSNNSGGIRHKWFRPVIGTFSAKGII